MENLQGTDKKKRILEHYENVLSGFTNKEKEHLEALEQLEDYEGKLAEAHEKLEKSRVTIEELQEIIAEFNSEIGKYEEKIKKLEEIQAKHQSSTKEKPVFARPNLVNHY